MVGNIPVIIQGDVFVDNRGMLQFVNEFIMNDIKRFYIIHSNKGIVRAWQAHRKEKKYFFVIKGQWEIDLVKIEHWDAPKKNDKIMKYDLNQNKSQILSVPGGYANGLLAKEENSILLVFSNLGLEESNNDLVRFDKDLWVNWSDKIKGN